MNMLVWSSSKKRTDTYFVATRALTASSLDDDRDSRGAHGAFICPGWACTNGIVWSRLAKCSFEGVDNPYVENFEQRRNKNPIITPGLDSLEIFFIDEPHTFAPGRNSRTTLVSLFTPPSKRHLRSRLRVVGRTYADVHLASSSHVLAQFRRDLGPRPRTCPLADNQISRPRSQCTVYCWPFGVLRGSPSTISCTTCCSGRVIINHPAWTRGTSIKFCFCEFRSSLSTRMC